MIKYVVKWADLQIIIDIWQLSKCFDMKRLIKCGNSILKRSCRNRPPPNMGAWAVTTRLFLF